MLAVVVNVNGIVSDSSAFITRGDNKLYWQYTFASEVDVAVAAGVQVSTAVSCWLV